MIGNLLKMPLLQEKMLNFWKNNGIFKHIF